MSAEKEKPEKEIQDKDKKEEPKPEDKDKKEDPKLSPSEALLKEIQTNIGFLDEAVQKKEKRLINKALRKNNSIRRKLSYDVLFRVVSKYHSDLLDQLTTIKAKIPSEPPSTLPEEKEPSTPQNVIPEVKMYVHLLVLFFLANKNLNNEAVQSATTLVHTLKSYNRRTLDALSGAIYFQYSLAYEKLNQLASIRSHLLLLHRTACLQHNEPGQATLTNCILRNYLHYNLISQADRFQQASNAQLTRSNSQLVRYLYYIGRIYSVQLKYSEAFNNLNQAIRKAPQSTAVGFRQAAHKLLIIVQLLMGDIPERSIFRQKALRRSLQPYFLLTQAVRVGDIVNFNEVVTKFKALFVRDNVYSLIIRLRHNVIKTGLRKINLSYSRISIKDICSKLMLDNEEDAEYIVAKAIHDRVIDAVIDRKQKFMYSKETTDLYSSQEPQAAFHKRIEFCNDIHNTAIKAMRFLPGAHKSASELEQEEAERKAEAEKEKEKDNEKGKDKDGKDKDKDGKAKDKENKDKDKDKDRGKHD